MKARLKILHALEELLEHKYIEDIAVSDIVERAGVARKTFYRNFQDKFDALSVYFAQFYQDAFE